MNHQGPRILRLLAAVVVIAGILSHMEDSFGQISESDANDFADRIIAAKDQLQSAKVPSLEISLAETSAAIAAVEHQLRTTSSPSNTEAWLDYLKMSEVGEAIADLGDINIEPESQAEARKRLLALAQLDKALGDIRGRLTINFPGLERAEIPRLRTAVRKLDAMLRHRDPEKSMAYLRGRMDDIATALRDREATSEVEAFYLLDELIRLLIETDQAPELVADVRVRFNNANLRIGVGSDLIARIATRPFSEPSDVNECLLGTWVRGKATLTGTVTTCLLPAQGHAKIQLILSGNLTSQNRGYRSPVTVDAEGYGTVVATKVLMLDDLGVRSQPAVATAELSSRIQRINHPLKLVRRIAMKKAMEQKEPSNREGARRLERRVSESFDQQTQETSPIGDGKSTPVKDLVNVLGRLGIEEPSQEWSSESRYVLTTLRQQTSDDLGAAVATPGMSDPHDLSIQIHESLVNNVMTRMLAGRTMTDPQLQRLVDSLLPGAEFGSPAKPDDDQNQDGDPEEALVTFSRTRPIIFEARGGKVWIGMRGTRFQQGTQSLKVPMRIRAEYLPVFVVGHGYMLQRQGEVAIDFPGTEQLSFRQIATRKKMELVFDRALPKQLLDKPIQIPLKQLPESGVRVQEISAQQGWLSLGLR